MADAAENDAASIADGLDATHAEAMKDPEYAAAYRAAEEREARLVESMCAAGNCVVLTDPEDPEYESGWGPAGCPCQDGETSVIPPAEDDAPRAGCACDPEDAALAEVVWIDGDGAHRVTCALCGATGALPPGSSERGEDR